MAIEDIDRDIVGIMMDLMRLSRLLEPADMADMLGAVGVEIETGMELVLERRLRRPSAGNVVPFPGQALSSPDP